jgi:hypothetical protein
MTQVRLIDAKLPDFGVPTIRPEIARDLYAERFAALGRARRAAGIDVLLIYADREHSANLSYVTGFDPRFEEALLIIAPGLTPTLLAGPENLDVRNERLVALVDDPGHGCSRRRLRCPFLAQADHGIGCGMSVAIVDADDELTRLRPERACEQHRCDDMERAHQPPALPRRAAV